MIEKPFWKKYSSFKSSFTNVLKKQYVSKIFNILPYTFEELKINLEKQFDNKMTWNNYGSYWHLDHIIPQSHFNFNSFMMKILKNVGL